MMIGNMSKIIAVIVLLFSIITNTCYDTGTNGEKIKETYREITYLAPGGSYTIGESVDKIYYHVHGLLK